jgi:capsular polysaccharide biosynthesis protein
MASPILPFSTEAAYAERAGLARQVLYEAERVEAGAPVLFPGPDPDFYDLAPLRYDFPAVTLARLDDVVVRGRSNILTLPDGVLRHGLADLAVETTAEQFYGRLALADDWSTAAWSETTSPFNVDYLPEAAVFSDALSPNYAHWTTEVLPRIAAFTRDKARAGIPLIVDAGLHANIMRSIRLVAGPDAPLYRLPADHLVRVGVLHNVSPTGYAPFKLRPQSPETICHGVFGGQALSDTVDRIRRGVGVTQDGGDRPKLLVRRNATIRHIVNEPEIELALAGLGFVVIEPERMTLEQQVKAFSGAGMVVGATGAAITNLAFCRPDCATIVLMPKFRHTAYWYWRRIAAAAGGGPVVHVSGEQVSRTPDPFDAVAAHQDFRVEVRDVLDAVAAAEAAKG